MNFDELYLRYLGVKLPPSDEPEEPEEDQKPTSSIPNDIVAFVQPPRRKSALPRRTSSPNDPLIGIPKKYFSQPPRRTATTPRRTSSPNDPLIGVPPEHLPRPSRRISAPPPASSRSDDKKKPDRDKEASDKLQIAVAADSAQPETTADISALDLEFGWSSEFGSRQVEVGSDDELVQAVATSLHHEGLIDFYLDDPIAYLKNFASYGWDQESDRQAEAYLQKYTEELKLHYAGQLQRYASRGERDTGLGQVYGDLQHLTLLGQLAGRAFFDTSAEISRLAKRGVFRGRRLYGGDFGQYDLTEDEFNFGRGGLHGIYFGDMMNISGRRRPITVPITASDPGGSGGSGNGGDIEYTYADVKDLVEMDVATAASNNDAAHYDDMLESVLGFKLNLEGENNNQEDIRQIRNLAKAATMIVDYFAEVYYEGDKNTALRAFQLLVEEVAHTHEHRHRYLDTGPHWHGHWHEIEGGAHSHEHLSEHEYEHAHEQLTIYLEDDRAGGDDHGRAPLPFIQNGIVTNEGILDDMYLGSLPSTVDDFEVGYSVGTILHEFGHVIDRRTGFTASLYEPAPEYGGQRRSVALGGKSGVNMDKQIPELAVEGFGAKEAVYNELAIAPFVTDVVEVSGETLHIFSILPDSAGKFDTFGSDFYNCSERGGCGPRKIGWKRSASGELKGNAIALRDAFREVFGGFLHQLIEDDVHE